MADQAIEGARRKNTPFLLTIPALGWVARDDDTASAPMDVPVSGGVATGPAADGEDGPRGAITHYDPSDNRVRTSVRSVARKGAPFAFPPDREDEVVYQDEWVAYLVERFGRADQGGVAYYAVDNEPDLWSSTHRDVHPGHPTYASTLETFLEHATAIKDVDPSAQVIGPVVSGWMGLFYSAADRGDDNFRTAADRRANGGMAFLPWFLERVRAHDERTGRRTLDALAVHWYPQGGEYGAPPDETTDARRLRATRQLWDPAYRDESWVARSRDSLPSGAVQLIPRLRAWIDGHYPGTRLAITEWNYGGDETINGALAIADVLGIFGRDGVDLAAYWRAPPPNSPASFAFRLYRDYDGQGGQFGDLSLPATLSARSGELVSVFASRDSQTDDVVIICINKQGRQAARVDLSVTGWSHGAQHALVYHYGPANPDAITREADITITQGRMTIELPGSTMALIRVPSAP